MALELRLCGVRGSSPAPGYRFAGVGGNTSSVAISVDGAAPRLLLDAGTGITQVSELLHGKPFDGTLVLTHLHWDHVQGLPFFKSADRDDATTHLLLPDQGDAEEVLERAVSPPHFPITPHGLQGSWSFDGLTEGTHAVEGVDLKAIDIAHKGGRTFGIRVSSGEGAIVYMPDHAPVQYGKGSSGVGAVHDAALELAGGADVLIHDGQFTREELDQAIAYGHATIDYAVELAEAAGVGRLVLTHHSPVRTDDQVAGLVKRYASGQESISFATEGDTFEAGPELLRARAS
jgi:ribonuclease BN (tRNA processing enzyme)